MKPEIRSPGLVLAASSLLIFADSAQAYVGPGAGLGVIGTLIAFVGAVLLAIVGFVWYPIKRLLRQRASVPDTAAVQQTAGQDAEQDETSGSLSQ